MVWSVQFIVISIIIVGFVSRNLICKSITVKCSLDEENFCSISPSFINLTAGNSFYIINPHRYLHPVERILEIRPIESSFIASIDSIFDQFPNLTNLHIHNCLNAVPFMRAASLPLQLVNFRMNFIKNVTTLAFDGAPNLEHIDLSSNSISSIENQAFDGLDRLFSLRLDNNKLGSLQSHTFDGAKSLSFINLRNNSITTIASGCFALANLKELILAENHLDIISDSIFDGAKQLRKVSFAHNKIKVINIIAIIQTVSIEWVSFEDNQLGMYEKQSINCTETPNYHMKYLNLARNNLKTTNIFNCLKCLKSLEMLNLNANEYTQFDNISDLKIYFPHLSIIHLIDNRINCNWLSNSTFDTTLIYTKSNRRKCTINNIECFD